MVPIKAQPIYAIENNMKKVVKVVKDDVITLDDVRVYNYYGFIFDDGSCGYIGGNDNGPSTVFTARFFHNMTRGNIWGSPHNSVKDCIDSLMSEPDCEVFEFDSYRELLKWASENDS